MSDLTPEKLAELRRLLDEFRETKPGRATAAPFAALVDALLTHADALLAAAAERDALAAKLDAVRALHPQEPFEMPNGQVWLRCGRCAHASDRPCLTIRTLDATPETGGES